MQDQEIEYTMHILRVQADEKHSQQLDPSYVPTPVLNERLTQSFHIPSETVVKFVTSQTGSSAPLTFARLDTHISSKAIGFCCALSILRETL